MSIRLKGERFAHTKTTTGGLDDIVTAFDLPADSVLEKVMCNVSMIGQNAAIEREVAQPYACAAYLIELDDPDAVEDYETLWDRFVPKYTDQDAIDLDTGVADVSPFWEPGEASFEQLFEMGDLPLRMFMRRKIMTFADPGSAGFRFQPAETPFEPQWMAADKFTIRINRRVRIRKPSVFIVGIAIPSGDDTTTSRVTLTEIEWGQIQFVESTLERALMDQINNVEAGATVTWESASLVLRKHLAPNIFEEVAGSYDLQAYNVFTDMQFQHTVPGKINLGTVDLTP